METKNKNNVERENNWKRESIERGYMTREDIERHLNKFDNPEDKFNDAAGKVNYLERVCRKRKLLGLRSKTLMVLYELRREWQEKATKESWGPIAEGYERDGKHENAAANWKLAGNLEKASEQYMLSAIVYEKTGKLEYAARLREKARTILGGDE